MGDLDVDALLSDLPTKKAVFMPVDGKMKEISLDFAPEVHHSRANPDPPAKTLRDPLCAQANAIAKMLGGDASFVGMYGAADIIIMSLRHPPASAKVNASALCKPFAEEEVKGPMLLVRMIDGSPEDITLKQWKEFFANPPEEEEVEEEEEFDVEISDASDDEAVSGEEEEESDPASEPEYDEDDEEDEIEGEAAIEEMLKAQVAGKFELEHGKAPSEEELEAIFSVFKESGGFQKAMERIAVLMGAGPGGEEEEDMSEEEEVEEKENEKKTKAAPVKKGIVKKPARKAKA